MDLGTDDRHGRLHQIALGSVRGEECETVLGSNSDNDDDSPWENSLCNFVVRGPSVVDYRYFTIRPAAFPKDASVVRDLITEYTDSLGLDLSFQDYETEFKSLPGKYSSDRGGEILILCRIMANGKDATSALPDRFNEVAEERWFSRPVPRGQYAWSFGDRYVALKDVPKPALDEVAIGMCCLRSLYESGSGRNKTCCELKRLYVLPSQRGMSLAETLVSVLLDLATERGYDEVKLDTLASMTAAQRLYQKLSFAQTDPYYDTKGVETVFLSRSLTDWQDSGLRLRKP